MNIRSRFDTQQRHSSGLRTVHLSSAQLTAVLISAAIVGATPASASPVDPDAGGTPSREETFLAALDQAGIGHANNQQAVGAAQNTCQRVRDLFSTAEIAEDLEKANPGLAQLHAVAFVKIARTVYCPGVGEGDMPGYPGHV